MNVFHGCIKTFFIICFDPRGGAKPTDGATFHMRKYSAQDRACAGHMR